MNSKQAVEGLLEKLGVQPSRRLGQNFLVDPNLVSALVRDAELGQGDCVLEIGAGLGGLTAELAATGAGVVAVELDRRLAQYLRERFSAFSNITVIEEDACRVDTETATGGRSYKCVSSLPYACASPVMLHLAAAAHSPQQMYLLVQQEVADRWLAEPDSREFGAITVRLQAAYTVQCLRRIPPEVFFPQPRVQSSYVLCTRRRDAAASGRKDELSRLCRAAFSQRRKKLRRVLEKNYDPSEVKSAFVKLSLKEDVRPEQVSVETYVSLAGLLSDAEKK